MAKKLKVGFLYYRGFLDDTDELIIKEMEKNVEVVRISLDKQYDIEAITATSKGCRLVINNASADPVTGEGIEVAKTLEELGKKVINSTHAFYYTEDKWMFYLKCLEHRIPTPKTHLLIKEYPKRKQIEKYLSEGPLVLKAVVSDKGQCVEKADTYQQLISKLKKIASRNPSSPIVAQQFMPHDNATYRVTLVGYKVIQAFKKSGSTWKQTGIDPKERDARIPVDHKLKDICERAAKAFGMEYCGLDLVRHKGKWYVIEANSCPGLSFYHDKEKVIKSIASYFVKAAKKLG